MSGSMASDQNEIKGGATGCTDLLDQLSDALEAAVDAAARNDWADQL